MRDWLIDNQEREQEFEESLARTHEQHVVRACVCVCIYIYVCVYICIYVCGMCVCVVCICVYHVTCDSTTTVQIPGEVKDEVSLAGKKSIETVKCVSATPLLCIIYSYVCI